MSRRICIKCNAAQLSNECADDMCTLCRCLTDLSHDARTSLTAMHKTVDRTDVKSFIRVQTKRNKRHSARAAQLEIINMRRIEGFSRRVAWLRSAKEWIKTTKPWKDPESIFCDEAFLTSHTGKNVYKCTHVQNDED